MPSVVIAKTNNAYIRKQHTHTWTETVRVCEYVEGDINRAMHSTYQFAKVSVFKIAVKCV